MLFRKIYHYYQRLKGFFQRLDYEKIIRKSGLFDEDYYLSHNEDVRKSKMSPLKHFLIYGGAEGRNPSEGFDTAFYLNAHPDVANNGINPLLHYILYGAEEGRKVKMPAPVIVPLTKRKSATLIFDHNLGGGTWTYVYNKLINASSFPYGQAILLVRYNPFDKKYLVEVRINSNIVEKVSYKDAHDFYRELEKSDYSKIIVNNLVSWPSTKEVLNWISQYKVVNTAVSVEFKGHDYYCICPCYILHDINSHYCGIRKDEQECNDCVHYFGGGKAVFLDKDNEVKFSVTGWRSMWKNFFENTVDIFEVFSLSAQKIFVQAYPNIQSKLKLVPHDILPFERYNIAILGNLSVHKGSEIIRHFCEYVDENHIADIQFYLFGDNFENIVSTHLITTGPYERYELPEKLKKANIDLIFIPSTWPETFCYTAGEAIALGYPVACFDLGGQADQVRNSDKGIILYSEDTFYLYQTFKRVCSALRLPKEAGSGTEENTPAKTVVIQDQASRAFLKWMYEQREDKSHFIPEAEDSIKRTDEMPKVIAAYLPQFHDFPENVRWFGKGFSEWTNSAQTLPQFLGHRQPHTPIDVGFYNLNTPNTMYRQAELAKKYGIAGFCVYYYWFSGKKLMDQPLKFILENKDLDFPFFLFWANDDWTMLWGNGATREVLYKGDILPQDADIFMQDVLPYMKDSRYIKINNKPVLLIYKIALSPRENYLAFVNRIQEIAIENGFDGLYMLSPIEDFMDHDNLEEIQENYKLNALIEFHPIAGRKGWLQKHEEYFDPACCSTCYDVDEFVQNKKYLLNTKANVFPGLFPDWDNTPRRYNRGAWILQNSPENYKQWMTDLIKWTKEHNNPDERYIFVNAWNDWAEGAHLEPDTYYGYSYLQKTREALEEATLKQEIHTNDQ